MRLKIDPILYSCGTLLFQNTLLICLTFNTVMTIDYRGEMDALIYPLFSSPSLDRDEAASLVQAMLRGEYFPHTPAAYSKAIEQALAQSDPVTKALEPPYTEMQVRGFLRLIHEELQKAKPWPATND
jgi:hypothetical protein